MTSMSAVRDVFSAPALPEKDIRDHAVYVAEAAPAERAEYVSSVGHGLWNRIYEPFPVKLGKRASRRARMENGFLHCSLTYGEVEYEPFVEIFNVLLNDGLRPGGVFVDIGCGVGKAVFAAAIGHDFDKCLGIEILQRLHDINHDDLLPRFEAHVRHDVVPESRQHCDIEFICGDATVLDWSEARVVFANSTCFDEALMRKLADAAGKLVPGSYVVTTTVPLPSDDFEVRHRGVLRQTWGDATVFVNLRLEQTDDATVASGTTASGSASALLSTSLRSLKMGASSKMSDGSSLTRM